MKLDGQGGTLDNPESRNLRPFQVSQGNDEMGCFRIVRTVDIGSREFGGTMGMGMINRDELFPGAPQSSKNVDQLRRVHLVFRGGLGSILDRNEPLGSVSSDEESAPFIRIGLPGVLSNLFEYSRTDEKVHDNSSDRCHNSLAALSSRASRDGVFVRHR